MCGDTFGTESVEAIPGKERRLGKKNILFLLLDPSTTVSPRLDCKSSEKTVSYRLEQVSKDQVQALDAPTESLTSMLPFVAREYGHTLWASSTSFLICASSSPICLSGAACTLSSTARRKPCGVEKWQC